MYSLSQDIVMRKLIHFVILNFLPAVALAQNLSLTSYSRIGTGAQAGPGKLSSFWYDEFKERILLVNTGSNLVEVFKSNGQFLYRIGEKGELKLPISVACGSNNKIFILEEKSAILKIYQEQTRELDTFNLAQIEPSKKANFTQLYLDKQENLYVVDSGNRKILILNKDLKLVAQVGTEKKGRFQKIASVVCDNSGRIFVADALNSGILVFGKKGKYLFDFEKSSLEDRFWRPQGIYIDLNNRIWAIDGASAGFRIYDTNGNLLQKIDSADSGSYRFFFPIQIAIDKYGLLYLLQQGKNQIEIFKVENF